MKRGRKPKKFIIFSLLILCSLFEINKIWSIIPDYSVHHISTSANCTEPVREICRVDQRSAQKLYKT